MEQGQAAGLSKLRKSITVTNMEQPRSVQVWAVTSPSDTQFHAGVPQVGPVGTLDTRLPQARGIFQENPSPARKHLESKDPPPQEVSLLSLRRRRGSLVSACTPNKDKKERGLVSLWLS